MKAPRQRLKTSKILSLVTLVTVLVLIGTALTTSAIAQSAPEEAIAPSTVNTGISGDLKYGLFAAAIAFSMGALGAAYAVWHIYEKNERAARRNPDSMKGISIFSWIYESSPLMIFFDFFA